MCIAFRKRRAWPTSSFLVIILFGIQPNGRVTLARSLCQKLLPVQCDMVLEMRDSMMKGG